MNTVHKFFKEFDQNGTSVIPMFIGDKWTPYCGFDKKLALNKWGKQYSLLKSKKFLQARSVSINEIDISMKKFNERICNNILLYPFYKNIKPLVISLYDLEKQFVFNNKGISNENLSSNPDIIIASDTFNFILNNDFGFNTLHVNGRLKVLSEDSFNKFLRIENYMNLLVHRPSNLLLIKMLLKILLYKIINFIRMIIKLKKK